MSNEIMLEVISCKCGASFAACAYPYYEEDKEWIDNKEKYIKDGCTVKTCKGSERPLDGKRCTCIDEDIDVIEWLNTQGLELDLRDLFCIGHVTELTWGNVIELMRGYADYTKDDYEKHE